MAFGQMAGMKLPTAIKRYYEGDLWSAYFFADATALANQGVRLFTTPRNQQGQGFATPLSISETDMDEGGRIANGLAFTVRQIAIELSYDDNWPVVRADLQNVQYYCVPTWKFLNAEIHVAPVQLIGQGGGIFGSTADTGAAEGGAGGSRIALNNGLAQTWVYYELPVLLQAGVTFALALNFGSAAAAVDGGRNDSDLIIRGHLVGVATSAVPTG